MKEQIGVLIVNLGTPDDPGRGAVYRYLKEFLLDPRVIDYSWPVRNFVVRGIIAPFRSGSSSKLYQQLWTEDGSPIKVYGHQVAEGVRELLPDNFHVELAMRYQSPSIASALDKLLNKYVDKIIVFPMFPQYASATTGSIHDKVMELLRKKDTIPEVLMINSYPTLPEMIKIFADNARKYNLEEYDHFIFSYHGLPQRQLRNSDPSGQHCLKKENCCSIRCQENKLCYSAQCHMTSEAIAAELGIADYTVCFQSRLGPEAWVQPYTSEVIEQRQEMGDKKLLVFSPAFVADCLETTIEIGYEYKEEFVERGGEKLDLVASLNNDPRWIKAIADMVMDKAGAKVEVVK